MKDKTRTLLTGEIQVTPFGNLEVCVNFDPHDRRWGWPVDYAEAVDVVTDTRRDLVKYVGNATLDGPVGKADDQVVFIRLV